jgi:hypothetical protein
MRFRRRRRSQQAAAPTQPLPPSQASAIILPAALAIVEAEHVRPSEPLPAGGPAAPVADWRTEKTDARTAAAEFGAGEIGPFLDIPGWIWLIFLSGWTTFFGLLLVFFTTSRSATFMVVVSALFAVFAFGLVIALAAQGRVAGSSSPAVIHTHTGDLSPAAAAAQVALIPIAVAIGLSAFILLAL